MNTRTGSGGGSGGGSGDGFELPPGTEAPRRRPRLRYELLGCAWHGHDLVGTDAATVVADDAVVVRESGGGPRWHRCLRCDAWVALPPPARPTRDGVPGREEIVLPLRGRPLKSRYILRLIAIDRGLHFLVLAALAGGVFAVLANQTALQLDLTAATSLVQGLFGGDILAQLHRVLSAAPGTLVAVGVGVVVLAVFELVEGIGLWRGRRWAEYLTFVITTLLLIPEVLELTSSVTPGKLLTLAINLAVVVYLLLAKRLFGLRGGAAVETAQRDHDISWAALQRHLPDTPPAGTDHQDTPARALSG